MQVKIKLFGEKKCAQSYRIRDFLQRNGVLFQWTEIARNENAILHTGLGSVYDSRFPVLKIGEHTLYAPTLAQIVHAVGWATTPAEPEYDLAIYGGGPAGLSAAVYGASEGLRTVLIERFSIGGQAGSTSRIENYLGFPEGISGAELASRARGQALRLGAEILLAAECVGGKLSEGSFLGMLDSGDTVRSRSIVCATGVDYTRLNLANEERLLGRGFYYGAGSSEASLCRGHVFVVGGGNSAGQAAIHLASRASKVTMLVRGESLKSTLSQYLVDRIGVASNIEVKVNCLLTGIEGADTGWVFACVGGKPQTDWTDAEILARDSAGYILTGTDLLQKDDSPLRWPLERVPYPMEASIPGTFVAGDLRANSIKRCATAVGEGAAAVASVHRYLSTMS
jgi:thioredoxin reductase (NADPH)